MTTELTPHHRPNTGGSDKSFGLTIAIAAVIFALFPLIHHGTVRVYLLVLAAPFALLAFFSPKTLAPLNAIWMKLGDLLSRIVSPIALGIVFFGVFTPTGFLMRLMGKDPLRLKLDRDVKTYWINREDDPNSSSSFNNQF